jgi:hypothetical protein
MASANIPKQTFGMAIPQVLSESEKSSMKNSVNTFMATRFSVSAFKASFRLKSIFRITQKGIMKWHENKLTTWSSLVDGNTYIMAGLMTAIFQGSPAWRNLAIETGLAGAQGSRPVLTTQLMTSWFFHNNIVRKNAENLVCYFQLHYLFHIQMFRRSRANLPKSGTNTSGQHERESIVLKPLRMEMIR